MEDKILDLLKEDLTKTEIKNIKKAFAICKENLSWKPRGDGTNSYLHSLRVAYITITTIKTRDYLTVLIAILHDIISESPTSLIDVETIFGDKVAGLVQLLSVDDSQRREDIQANSILKIRKNYKLNNAPHIVRIVKCADQIDNLSRLEEMPKNYKKFKSIPYWLVETKTSILPIAEKTDRNAYIKLKHLINKYEPLFPLPN